MTVISPNSISGITSLSCTSDSLSIHDSGGNLVRTLITGGGDVVTGVLTVSQIGNATDTLTIPGNLTVQGTRTILNTDELNINDKLVGIASTATPSSLSQDNAGLIIYGQTNVDFKYEVKKAAVGLNTALCVAGIVTAMSGLNSPSDIKTTAGTINVKSGSSINTNSDTAAHGALHKNTNSGEFAIVSGGTGGNNYLSFYTSASGAPSEKLRITAEGRLKLTGSSESNITTQAATAGGTTTIDMDTSDNWIITMGGNTTIGDPSNEKVGQTGSIWLVQDGTGSRTAAWNSAFKWVGGTAPTLTTTASMIDRVDYIVKAAGEINAVISLDVK